MRGRAHTRTHRLRSVDESAWTIPFQVSEGIDLQVSAFVNLVSSVVNGCSAGTNGRHVLASAAKEGPRRSHDTPTAGYRLLPLRTGRQTLGAATSRPFHEPRRLGPGSRDG